ncbi:MAG: flagellar motor switch protein FliN [Syntrophobacterales bacterium]|nr:flagellar motor switch protein FliN [Syntrophobacterales bacterium]
MLLNLKAKRRKLLNPEPILPEKRCIDMEQNESSEEIKETKENEEIGWDDVQEEMEASAGPVEKKEVNSVRFEEIKQGETKKASLDIDFLMDIPLTVTVELGRGKMMISELLQLGQGSVVELTKLAGEPMEVFVNDRLIARGEVVVVNEKFGVRLTDVVSHAERLNKLK